MLFIVMIDLSFLFWGTRHSIRECLLLKFRGNCEWSVYEIWFLLVSSFSTGICNIMATASPKVIIRNMNQSVREKQKWIHFYAKYWLMLVIFVRNFRQKLELTDMRDAECVQEIANFSQVLFPPISFRVTKKQAIYMDVTYSLHISFIYSYISPFISFRVTKNILYLNIWTSHILYPKKIHFFYHISIFSFSPLSRSEAQKNNLYWCHIFSHYVFHIFLSYINFPSLLVQLYKRQPIYGGCIFSSSFTYSYITCIKILTFPSIWFRVKEDGWCTKEQPACCTYYAKIKWI